MHIYTQTTTSSKELDIARSGVPATVHSFASRRCTTPEHRISGCCEHENNKKPLKLFPLIVLKLIYIYIQYIKSYRYNDIYIYDTVEQLTAES